MGLSKIELKVVDGQCLPSRGPRSLSECRLAGTSPVLNHSLHLTRRVQHHTAVFLLPLDSSGNLTFREVESVNKSHTELGSNPGLTDPKVILLTGLSIIVTKTHKLNNFLNYRIYSKPS